MTNRLQGLRVLNTRPLNQGRALSQAIRKEGGVALDFPAFEIHPRQEWLSYLPWVNDCDYLIFISANAVDCFFEAFFKIDSNLPEKIKTVVIGKATAMTLKKRGIPVDFIPEIADSEHLIQLPLFQDIKHKKVGLVKGKGGRPLIEDYLNKAQARLRVYEVYTREPPDYTLDEINSVWQNDAVDIILFTSEQALVNLENMFGQKANGWLRQKPCLVISNRLAQAAHALGIEHILISEPDKIFDTLCDYNQGIIHGRNTKQR